MSKSPHESEDENKDQQDSKDSSMDMQLQEFIDIKSRKKKGKYPDLSKVTTRAHGKRN